MHTECRTECRPQCSQNVTRMSEWQNSGIFTRNANPDSAARAFLDMIMNWQYTSPAVPGELPVPG
jgi:hypothetical protein